MDCPDCGIKMDKDDRNTDGGYYFWVCPECGLIKAVS